MVQAVNKKHHLVHLLLTLAGGAVYKKVPVL
jgi:hypothetical protein